jgi:hypothetical protein
MEHLNLMGQHLKNSHHDYHPLMSKLSGLGISKSIDSDINQIESVLKA